MTHMRKASVADAKAHFSELIDLAEHKGQRVLILRHGKPAAAIVPVEVATAAIPEAPRRLRRMSEAQIDAILAGFGQGETSSALDALYAARRRLESDG